MMDEMKVVEQRRLTAEEWQKHFDEQPKSGKRVTDYCRENGLTVHKFYYWRVRLREQAGESTGSGFVECRVREAAPGCPVVLECKGGYRLQIAAGFDERTFKRVLGVLAQC
jgi:transposase-like protein